jgi:hypothetical protein
MRVLWWIFFLMGAGYEIAWLWQYIASYNQGYYSGIGFNGFHPWYYGFFGALYILGILQLYPLARNYDNMGKM